MTLTTKLRIHVGRSFAKTGRTKQSFREECDINVILAKWVKTGPNHQATNRAEYGDFSDVHDYQSAHNALIAADESFLTLPAKTRALFGNDPNELLVFVDNPENKEEAIEMGLLPPDEPLPPEPAPAPGPPTPAPENPPTPDPSPA